MDENLYLEVVKPDGAGSKDPGEIVATHLHHHGAPLIRYRVGDLAVGISRGCPCGSNLRVLEGLLGKSQDTIVTPEGKYVLGHLLSITIKTFPGIIKFRVIQKTVDLILIKLVLDGKPENFPEGQLVKVLQERVSPGIEFRVSSHRELEPEPSGKYHWIVSELTGGVIGELNRKV
jgi:phenylacetate-CoA ligase